MGQWLYEIGLSHLVNLFMQNNVDGKSLLLVDSNRLKVRITFYRVKIMKTIVTWLKLKGMVLIFVVEPFPLRITICVFMK